MSILRILLFSVVLFLLRIATEVVLGAPPPEGELSTSVLWNYLLRAHVPDALVMIGVFVALARVQMRWPYAHALCVIILHGLLAAALLVALGGDMQPSPLWPLEWLLMLVSVVIGTEIGRRLRARAEKQALPA